VIGVDKVQANRRIADKDLSLFGFADIDFLPFENRGGACFVNTDRVGHLKDNL